MTKRICRINSYKSAGNLIAFTTEYVLHMLGKTPVERS